MQDISQATYTPDLELHTNKKLIKLSPKVTVEAIICVRSQ